MMLCDRLTAREIDILRHIVRGESNRAIADELTISEATVHNHVASILDKLMLESRTQAAVYALRCGISSLEDVPYSLET
jgi:DNA-binding NarL/FixJ family response regulator